MPDYMELITQLSLIGATESMPEHVRNACDNAAKAISKLYNKVEAARKNNGLTLNKMSRMAQWESPVWCKDPDGSVYPGILCVRGWQTHFVALPEYVKENGSAVREMVEDGAKFYIHNPVVWGEGDTDE